MFELFFSEQVWLNGLIMRTGTEYSLFLPILLFACVVFVAYMLGSVNTAIILVRLVYREDIREKGSGNAGMTNVMRNYGFTPALFTLLGDMFKVLISMVTGTLLLGINGAYIAGLFCVLGHIAPAIYKFKGGKGVASTAMFVLYADWKSFLILLAVFVFLVALTKYLSLGSVTGMLMLPLVMFRMDNIVQDKPLRLFITFLIAGLVVYMHRGNIVRIMNKTERKFRFRKTVKKSEENVSLVADEQEENNETSEPSKEELKRKQENRKKSAKKKK